MKKADIMNAVQEIGGLTAGATASKFFQNKLLSNVSFIPEKFRGVVPVALGALLMKQKGIIGDVGRGMIAEGGSTIVTHFVPGMAGLSSDDINGVGDKVDSILDNILSGGEELGALDTGLHDDLSDDLGDDLSGDDDLSDDLSEVEY